MAPCAPDTARQNFASGVLQTYCPRVRFLAAIMAMVFVPALVGAESRPRVITSFLPLYCWTANVAGDKAVVENLLPSRAEPHEYAFKPSDVQKLSGADLVVINGLRLESWVSKWARMADPGSNRMAVATAGLDEHLLYGGHHHHDGDEHGDGHNHNHEQPNEHTWLDPILAAHAVTNILTGLQRIAPSHAAAYTTNAYAYVARLHALDAEIRQLLAGITNRAIVTHHDAFPYFARRYGLEIAGVVEQVPEVNPTPKYLAKLGRMMRERGIRVIFVPPGGDTRLARRIAADLRVQLVELDTLESGPLSPSAYEERMRRNATVLRDHLK
jgi:zinc transport system substrate-binding protein